jgi:hypothetical protein
MTDHWSNVDSTLRKIDELTAEPPTPAEVEQLAGQLDDGTPDGTDFAKALRDGATAYPPGWHDPHIGIREAIARLNAAPPAVRWPWWRRIVYRIRRRPR